MKVLGVDVQPAVAQKEPVLEVPAIDMTEQAQSDDTARPADIASADVAKPTNRRRAAKPKPKVLRARQAAARTVTPKRTRDGSVGRETFAAVEALVKKGNSKTGAFKAVAVQTGRSAGTVAATYYRLARANGAQKPSRRRAKPATAARAASPSARRPARAGGGAADVDRLAAGLVNSVNELAAAMRSQSAEVADLRRRLDGVRSLLR